jgi:hypothetical protein
MELEEQICGLELAKRLKELGVRQESRFFWGKRNYTGDPTYELFLSVNPNPFLHHGISITADRINPHTERPDVFEFEDYGTDESCSAFTVAELGEMLPWGVQDERHKKYSFWTAPVNDGNEWGCAYEGAHKNLGGFVFVADTEADARAKMLIYLLENNLILHEK